MTVDDLHVHKFYRKPHRHRRNLDLPDIVLNTRAFAEQLDAHRYSAKASACPEGDISRPPLGGLHPGESRRLRARAYPALAMVQAGRLPHEEGGTGGSTNVEVRFDC
jgi:hypothetical protein